MSRYMKNKSECGQLVTAACEDGYKRLIYPSIEREIRAELSANAQEGAIKVFSSNLRQLLMQPPVKDTVTLGLDPGYAHGCKTAVVDATGKVLDTAIIYITPPKKDTELQEKRSSSQPSLSKKFRRKFLTWWCLRQALPFTPLQSLRLRSFLSMTFHCVQQYQ